MKATRLTNCMLLALAGAGLAACGGGGGSSSGTADSSTIGTISGFGSIYVNGVEFETGSASYRVDDEDRFDDSALAVGMKVKVTGTINSDGTTGTATRVYYDDDVEGPIDSGSLVMVDADTKTFTILGMAVTASATGTIYDDGADFGTLAEGQKLEVSGYFDGNTLLASRIEKQDNLDDEYELKGSVSAYDGMTVTLTLQNGATAGPYPLGAGVELDIPADPTGLFVELRLLDTGGVPSVTRIEADDADGLDDSDHEVSVRGILGDDGSGGLLVNGIPFTTDAGTAYEPASLEGALTAGMEVKVEGHMQDGVLLAGEIETEHGEIGITARVIEVVASDAKNGVVTLDLGNSQSLDVYTGNSSQFEDESAFDLNDDDSFNLDDLIAGMDYVEIEAYLDDNGKLHATSIEREDGAQATRIEAPVDDYVANASLTLLGIEYTIDAGTGYEVNDTTSDITTFFANLDSGDRVEVKDIEPNGIAEELELED